MKVMSSRERERETGEEEGDGTENMEDKRRSECS
jgi:hypothetical protein